MSSFYLWSYSLAYNELYINDYVTNMSHLVMMRMSISDISVNKIGYKY